MDRHGTYTALLLRHRTQMWRMCWLRAHGNWDLCCDLLQEASIALWLNLDKLRPDATPGEERAWVRWQVQSWFEHMGRRRQLSTVPITAAMADSLADDDFVLRVSTVAQRLVPEEDGHGLTVDLRTLVGGAYERVDVLHNTTLLHAALHRTVAADGHRAQKAHDAHHDQKFHQCKCAFHLTAVLL